MTESKTITFAIPCYNSAAYMDKCIESLLTCGNDIEIIIVNDGSTKDNTREKADEWQERYPNIIRAIHKENGGHGSAVNTGLREATGRYYKVVDSDDWLDPEAMQKVMAYLRLQCELAHPTDMVIGNYVYEKVHEGTSKVMGYRNVFPQEREFGWSEIGHFSQSQYLLMHSVIYRTELLHDIKLQLPENCFYVDNIFVYVPLPYVKTMYYMDVDMYRYFIGREDQSVNESVMMGRIDQQLRITKVMIDSHDIDTIQEKKLAQYMRNYLAMMMCICSIFLRMINDEESEAKRKEVWDYLRNSKPETYERLRRMPLDFLVNLPGERGRQFGVAGYRLAQKIFKFN